MTVAACHGCVDLGVVPDSSHRTVPRPEGSSPGDSCDSGADFEAMQDSLAAALVIHRRRERGRVAAGKGFTSLRDRR